MFEPKITNGCWRTAVTNSQMEFVLLLSKVFCSLCGNLKSQNEKNSWITVKATIGPHKIMVFIVFLKISTTFYLLCKNERQVFLLLGRVRADWHYFWKALFWGISLGSLPQAKQKAKRNPKNALDTNKYQILHATLISLFYGNNPSVITCRFAVIYQPLLFNFPYKEVLFLDVHKRIKKKQKTLNFIIFTIAHFNIWLKFYI